MTTERDARTRTVMSWLREDAHEDAERVLLRALDEVDTTPQRRSWWPARRFPNMHSSMKLGLAAAAVVVVLLAGYQLLPRTGGSGGIPTNTPRVTDTPGSTTTPSEAPSGSPGPSPVAYSSTAATGPVAPGSIVLDGAFPLAIAFDVPAGWSRNGGTEGAEYVGLTRMRGDLTPAGVSWALIGNVYPDACRSADGPADPPIGPTVDDLVGALTSIVGFDATAPTDVTVDGFAGKRFKLTAAVDPGAAGCDDPVWLALWDFPTGKEPAHVPAEASLEFWILDVEGTRLVMFTEDYGATPAEMSEATAIMESVRFE